MRSSQRVRPHRERPPAIVAREDAVLGDIAHRRGPSRPTRSEAPASGRRRWRARRGRSNRTGSRSRSPRGRASSRTSRPWSRHRRRGSGRRTAGSERPVASSLASTTFCWLPPDSVPDRLFGRVRLDPASAASRRSTIAASARGSMKPCARPAPARDSTRFSRTGLAQQQALCAAVLGQQRHARSPATARGAGCGWSPVGRQTSTWPWARIAPNSAMNSSRWPWPCSPATPSTSPSCSAKSTSWRRGGRR